MNISRKFIDWKATGYQLFQLRNENIALRRYVCSNLKKGTDKCKNEEEKDCSSCNVIYMDRNISRPELAEVFGVSEALINNWETARSHIDIEDLLFYCQIAQVKLEEILVFYQP